MAESDKILMDRIMSKYIHYKDTHQMFQLNSDAAYSIQSDEKVGNADLFKKFTLIDLNLLRNLFLSKCFRSY